MKRIRDRFSIAAANDSGMTLAEVMIAIAIMGIVATSAVALIITGVVSSATHQRGQIAITVANQAMESASAQNASLDPLTGVSYLYKGRFQTAVTDAWGANLAVSGDANTYPGWDPTATVASTPSLPITSVVRRSGTDYTTATLIGSCYQTLAGGDCDKVPSFTPHIQFPAAPNPAPTGTSQLIRVIVSVTWTAGESCQVTACRYQTTSLIDPHEDLQWNIHD